MLHCHMTPWCHMHNSAVSDITQWVKIICLDNRILSKNNSLADTTCKNCDYYCTQSICHCHNVSAPYRRHTLFHTVCLELIPRILKICIVYILLKCNVSMQRLFVYFSSCPINKIYTIRRQHYSVRSSGRIAPLNSINDVSYWPQLHATAASQTQTQRLWKGQWIWL